MASRPGRDRRGDRDLDMLADVLHAVVHDGAGVSFIVPFTMDEARAFWAHKVVPGVRDGTRCVLVARLDERIIGSVQFERAWPPNQPHRAEVAKLLVHPVARRCGVARALMIALEQRALSEGRTLLTLDTWTGGQRRVALPVAGVRRGRRDSALRAGIDDARARADDDHVQGTDVDQTTGSGLRTPDYGLRTPDYGLRVCTDFAAELAATRSLRQPPTFM